VIVETRGPQLLRSSTNLEAFGGIYPRIVSLTILTGRLVSNSAIESFGAVGPPMKIPPVSGKLNPNPLH
jgi:hypothetical protein